jgi:hypothetical protein
MIQKIFRYLQGKRRHSQSEQAKAALLSGVGNPDTTTPAFAASLEDPTSFYERTFIGFHRSLPDGLRNHREYFKQEKRGFGEDAFHVMWWRLFNDFKPTSFLEILLKDWEVCAASVKPGGIIILDDSSLSTSYRPPAFATGGHPGPSRLASEIDSSLFREILQVGHNRLFQKAAQ